MTQHPRTPLVSIITPVHNDGQYIGASADAICNQTMGDFEWLLIDDASGPETAGILARLSATDSRIRVVTLPVNGGPAQARNAGVRSAKGEFIAFCDADDIWDPKKLEYQCCFMREHNVDFSYHDYVSFEDGSGRPMAQIGGPDRLTLFSHNARRGVGCLAVMIRRSMVRSTLFPKMPAGMIAEDFAAWASLLQAGVEGRRLPQVLAWYRVRKRSFSSDKLRSARSVWFIMRSLEGFGKITSTFFLACFAGSVFSSRVRARLAGPRRSLAAPPWH
ncbi:glycosyltransferase family 2 protein [Cupriavidus necator]|uniref:glycosyltransferase family 2 protein n=1 Tax=Cupriavidus necator TaxID=106590 RepID=UPI00148FFA21|nr:glycosyltransferase family 2 protein [Cupriavidus necator]NOV25076.1 glycosyltransferase family 2 protein [Cupriavidus necator]